MTIGEAVQLVIQASSLAKGNEVFVLDMGRMIKIKDLAFKMAQLSGLKPYLEGEGDADKDEGDIAVRITGLRPGEKMYEELSYGDNLVGTAHPRIMTVSEEAMTAKEMRLAAKRLDRLVATEDQLGLIETLIEIGDYRPEKANQNATAEAPISKTDGKVVPMPRIRG
jgi:FlaA1/EpsC-like NDP-sugar epimerase